MMNFELGAKSAAMYVYPTTVPRLCQFHLSQSIMKRVKKEHLLNTYKADNEFKIAIRALGTLPYLPVNLIGRGSYVLEERNSDDAEPVYKYFKNTYVQTRRGREPRFPPVIWNQHNAVLVDLGRTNNAWEAYNLNLKMHLTAYHPPLSRVIEVLKAEEDNTYNQMRKEKKFEDWYSIAVDDDPDLEGDEDVFDDESDEETYTSQSNQTPASQDQRSDG